jgi:quinate dehydrogenase
MEAVPQEERGGINRYGQSLLGSDEDNSTKTRTGFLFGHPVAHALGPKLHNILWKRHHLPGKFGYVESMDKKDFLSALHAPNCVGASITMPHKVACMSDVDELTEEGQLIGAINTVFVRLDAKTGARKYIGTNTDCIGIRDAFEASFPGIREAIRGRTGLVIGGGGTTRAAVYALWKFFGITVIYLVNRLETEVEQVTHSMATAGCTVMFIHVKTVDDAERRDLPRIVVGAIPDILPETESEIQAAAVVSTFLKKLQREQDQKGFLLDMCYHPSPMTRLITSAHENGWQTITGIEPLIFQGFAQDVLWLERPMEQLVTEEISQVVRAELMLGLSTASRPH